MFIDSCSRGHNHTERQRGNRQLETLHLLFSCFNVRQAISNIGICLDRDKHREELNEYIRTQMEQLKMQTECKTQLILLARLSHRSSDKAKHLRMCQRQQKQERDTFV